MKKGIVSVFTLLILINMFSVFFHSLHMLITKVLKFMEAS